MVYGVVAWSRGNALCPIYVVVLHRTWLVFEWVIDWLRAGKPSRQITSRLGQLSLPSLRGR